MTMYCLRTSSFQSRKEKTFQLWSGTEVAHRGNVATTTYPENSISGCTYATTIGVDAIEIDVQLSKNNELVVFHDTNLQRMCGIDGDLENYTSEQLSQMKFLDFPAEGIPTLKQLIVACREINPCIKFMIEVKPSSTVYMMCRKIRNIYNELDLYSTALLISFDIPFLYCMKLTTSEEDIPTCLLYEYNSPFIGLYIHLLGVVAIGPAIGIVSDETIRDYTRKQFLVYSWTVNDSKTRERLIAQGATVASDVL